MNKQLLLSIILLFSIFAAEAQTILIEDGFEDYEDFAISGFGGWITLDLDGSTTYTGGGGIPWENANDPQAFIIFNPVAAMSENVETGEEVRNFDPHGGQKYAGSWAAVMPGDDVGGAGPNDDWLISPPLELGASENELTFWVKSLSNSYGLENYQVGIYTGAGIPVGSSDLTLLPGAVDLSAPYPEWELKTFSLDDYSNQTIRVGIHCISENVYFFMVDDFKVTTATTAGVNNSLSSLVSVYPNPATNVVNISGKNDVLISNVSVTDVNGRLVKQVNSGNINATQISLSGLEPGVYIVTILLNEGSMTKKIVKN